MKKVVAVIALLAPIIFSGCTTLADAKAAKGTGQYQIYDKEFNVVWQAAIDAVNGSGLDLVSNSKEKGSILAQRGRTAFSHGENVAIFVEPYGRLKTRVEIVSKRAVAYNLAAPNWEGKLLALLNEKLK
jgi:hypothetical protein